MKEKRNTTWVKFKVMYTQKSYIPDIPYHSIQIFVKILHSSIGLEKKNASLILQSNLLPLYSPNDNLGRILGNHFVVVQHFKLFRCILAHV